MCNLSALSDSQVILLAAQYIADVNVESLQILASKRQDVLTRDLIYRLLLTLYPSSESARSALLSLLRSVRTDFVDVSHLDNQLDVTGVTKLSPAAANSLANQLQLAATTQNKEVETGDTLADFAIAWSHHVESTDGTLEELLPIIDECMLESPTLERWATTYLLPLLRLQYHFYADEDSVISLHRLESVSGLSGVKLLLQFSERHSAQARIARDLDELVSPWLEGINTLGGPRHASWTDVYEWILDTSLTDFPLAAKALLEWDGPPSLRRERSDVGHEDLAAFAQSAFAVIYGNKSSLADTTQTSESILRRFAEMVGVSLPVLSAFDPPSQAISEIVTNASDADLLHNKLLSKENKLTRVSESAVMFLAALLKTAKSLLNFKIHHSVADIARACLSASEERQSQELRRILQQIPKLTTIDPDWPSIREQILWLRSWHRVSDNGNDSLSSGAFLGHLSNQSVERALLDTLLGQGHYAAARNIYLESSPQPLEPSVVEDQVVAALYSAYDNASNGNRNRGGVKRATDILSAFRPSFPKSQIFQNVEHLLKATHSLSFYQLTLQHGVPFRPVNIRVNNDPLDLVARVLEQDTKSYAKLDDLVEIGRNLVLARLRGEGDEQVEVPAQLLEAERRVTYLAITSALAAHDFDTAYSYTTTRLSTSVAEASGDDYSWRAAYAAGRYRPMNPPKDLHNRIGSLSKRMDLLSLSLTLAPQAESLSEILGQWRRCEEEMDTLKSQALEQERSFDGQGDGTMPGGFGLQDQDLDAAETRQAIAKRHLGGGSATYEEEAPMGLFDVAKGAASALRKSAFPLNAGSLKDLKIRDGHSRQASHGSVPTSPVTDDGGGRVRKRDMVSNMVTSGLVSGMGWVLGTEPVSKRSREDE